MYAGLWQQLSTVNSGAQPQVGTIVAAATIAPTTFLTVVTGTTNVATITPPIPTMHTLALLFSDAAPGDVLTTGNVLIGTTLVTTNVPVLLIYNPLTAKYSPTA